MKESQPLFDNIWRRFDDFEFSDAPVQRCAYAESFFNWAIRMLDLTEDAGVVGLNQAKVLLVDKYFEHFSIAPKRHRYHFSPRGHVCIFQVFLEIYQQIKARELALSPPMLFLPRRTPPSPPPQIAGIFIGEEE